MKRSYSDDETQAILARALEIDAQSPAGLAPEQLESIAADLGISPSALEKAMSEHGGRALAPTSPAAEAPMKQGRRSAVRTLTILLIVAAVALVASRLFGRVTVAPTRTPIQLAPPPQLPGHATPPPRIIPAETRPTTPPTVSTKRKP